MLLLLALNGSSLTEFYVPVAICPGTKKMHKNSMKDQKNQNEWNGNSFPLILRRIERENEDAYEVKNFFTASGVYFDRSHVVVAQKTAEILKYESFLEKYLTEGHRRRKKKACAWTYLTQKLLGSETWNSGLISLLLVSNQESAALPDPLTVDSWS